MAILVTRRLEDSQKQADPCNFSEPTANVMVEQQIPIEDLKLRCDRYKDYLAALQPPQDNLMIRASNFTTDSVLQLIQANPGSAFIRVYYGIKEDGQHVFFMGAVEDSTSLLTQDTSVSSVESTDTGGETPGDPTYIDDCCSCPPRGGCQDDPLITWEP
ncbi:hypothetical protein [Rufibacter sp. LB8]|uniref:hypothetical protein n=1 Tax=Rufibacter sp. LB8 TaxID=2777781 RepID=UPI00178C6A66|nr:hypothetical protein [Rufibacter sp. LB8]